jgi:hypothetical protein
MPRVRITPEYPGLVISDDGRIQGPSGTWLKGGVGRGDYLHISHVRKTVKIHIVVCTAFHGPKPTPEHQVAHRNGVRTDNRASNLRWATSLENHADMEVHGTVLRGSGHPEAKLTESQVRKIREERESGTPLKTIASKYGVAVSTIGNITVHRSWSHI